MALDNTQESKLCIRTSASSYLRRQISTIYFYQNCRSVYNIWYLLPPRTSNHMALDNTQVTQASTLRDRNDQIFALRSHCRSVYNISYLLPSRPSNHMALDNSHNSKFCITRWQSSDLRIAISTMQICSNYELNSYRVYNFWCLLPSRPSTQLQITIPQI